MKPFHYTRPHIGLDLTVSAIPHQQNNGCDLWELQTTGTINGQPIEYSELWFPTSDAVVRSVQDNDDVFYKSLLSYEAMETLEADGFAGIPEFKEE
jgi:hypothetical protein